MHLTKSNYLTYRDCPETLWYVKHMPEVLTEVVLTDFDRELIANGALVEEWALKLFTNVQKVTSKGEAAVKQTQEFIEQGASVIYQATVEVDGFYVMMDILTKDGDGWMINEVKASTNGEETSWDKEHLYDATFQTIVAERAGLKIKGVQLFELNSAFRKHGPINPSELILRLSIDDEVAKRREEVEEAMKKMQELIAQDTPPVPCDCIYVKGRKRFCQGFTHMHPEVPNPSIHDLARIGSSKKKLESLVNEGYLSIDEIPEEFELTEKLRNQVIVVQTQKPIIEIERIKDALHALEYPLYYLDYETAPTAIPVHEGCRPYQQVPFQFSLHVQAEPHGPLEHVEYLHTDPETHPMLALGEQLLKAIGPEGNIIVWNQSFEKKCNQDLAELIPEYSEKILEINERVYDLMEIFQKQWYLHPDFKGSYSIKNVLPVLVPDLSYAGLEIANGGMAFASWKLMMDLSTPKNQKVNIAKDLRTYCTLDTLAMVKILEALWRMKG